MKVLFAIPTMFNSEKQDIIENCVNNLIKQCKNNNIEYKIILICHEDNIEFFNWNLNSKHIIKIRVPVKFNISISLNRAINEISNEDYFCFIHDDIIIHDDLWIQKFIEIYKNIELKAGVLGLRRHYQGKSLIRKLPFLKRRAFLKKFNYEIEEHTWVDGLMFISVDIIKKVGNFDEKFFGDCESEDYNYRVKELGFKNYKIVVPHEHFNVRFFNKVNNAETTHFMDLVEKSRIYRKRKWKNKPHITKNLVDLT